MKRELKKQITEQVEVEEPEIVRRKYKGGVLISLFFAIPFSLILLPMCILYVLNKGILFHIYLRNELFKDWETIKKKA